MKRFLHRTAAKIYLIILLLSFSGISTLYGQRFSISTNTLELLNLGTINSELGLSVAQNWSLYLSGRFNPFTFKYRGNNIQNRQLNLSIGGRYWPWHTNAGWFLSGEGGYTVYNWGGILSPATYEGEIIGATIGAGYSLLVNRHFNIEFGLGGLVGRNSYIKYACPRCGRVLEQKKKLVILPDNVMVQLSYIIN